MKYFLIAFLGTFFLSCTESERKIQQSFYVAGDVGAFSKEYKKRDHIIEYAYFKENNITYVATGMGGGVRDNIVIVDIYQDKSVKLNLIHLNGDDINSLGKLKQ